MKVFRYIKPTKRHSFGGPGIHIYIYMYAWCCGLTENSQQGARFARKEKHPSSEKRKENQQHNKKQHHQRAEAKTLVKPYDKHLKNQMKHLVKVLCFYYYKKHHENNKRKTLNNRKTFKTEVEHPVRNEPNKNPQKTITSRWKKKHWRLLPSRATSPGCPTSWGPKGSEKKRAKRLRKEGICKEQTGFFGIFFETEKMPKKLKELHAFQTKTRVVVPEDRDGIGEDRPGHLAYHGATGMYSKCSFASKREGERFCRILPKKPRPLQKPLVFWMTMTY